MKITWIALSLVSLLIGAGGPDKGPLVINEENFYRTLNDVHYGSKRASYLGRTVKVVGMVFNDPKQFAANQGYVGRYLMMCCASDSTVAGFFMEGASVPGFKAESWVEVTGTLREKKTSSGMQPVIEVASIGKAKAQSPFITPDLTPDN